ncbi:APC family permease [Acidianus manzaensis]|uniref:Amino acid transporter n=1 Tax=Acidianus manzaensis TaxID=282676 RepID=A0A1W6JYN6_9CREN|nr:APC family permease [Acidianus manzaensis]ARM75386.1 hypothetical protein B6F84_04655 [Acidianus manzaensis]
MTRMSSKNKNNENKIFIRESSGLVKQFSSLDMLTLVLSFSIGSGILFFTVGITYEYPGSFPLLSLIIDAIPLFASASVIYFLGLVMPKIGGQYVWISRILSPSLGYFINIFTWLGYCIIIGDVAYIGASFLSDSLTIAGLVTHSPSITDVGKYFTSPIHIVIIAIIITILFTLLDSFSIKLSKFSIFVAFYIPLALLLILDFTMLLESPSTAPSLWNNVFGPSSYQNIISLSTQKGWSSSLISFSLASTLLAVIPLNSSWSGFSHFSGWLTGDAKSPRKSLFFATIGAGIVAFFLMALTIYSYQHLFGAEFISRLGYVSSSVGITPSIPLLGAVALSTFPVLAIAVGFIMFLFPIKDILPSVIAQSRQIFAASFDRLLPEKLTYVSKNGIPIISYAITATVIVISILMVSPLFPLGLYVATDLFSIALGFLQIFTAITAIQFPISKHELYTSAPSPVNKEIFGIPLISILGAISLIGWIFILADSFYGVMSSKVGFEVMLIISIIVGAIFLLYSYFNSKLSKEGINVELVGKEIPPD